MLGMDIIREFSSPLFKTVYRLFTLSKKELDITNKAQINTLFSNLKPHIVINCAAYTNVNGSESHQAEAYAVNVLGPKLLAEACKQHHAILVYFSTDYVFDGNNSKGYF